MTWDYEKSFLYWNKRQYRAGDSIKIKGLEGWDLRLKARAEVHRRMANDSRLHADIRKASRGFAKKMFDHINGTCVKPPNRWGFVYECDYCRHRADYERVIQDVAAGKYGKKETP